MRSSDSTAVKAIQQRTVECEGRDRAQKTSRSSTAAKEVSSRDSSLYHWNPTSAVERVGLPLCNGFTTLKTFSHKSTVHPYLSCQYSFFQVLRRWANGESDR